MRVFHTRAVVTVGVDMQKFQEIDEPLELKSHYLVSPSAMPETVLGLSKY